MGSEGNAIQDMQYRTCPYCGANLDANLLVTVTVHRDGEKEAV